MSRTLLLLFSTAAALLLASGAVLALPSQKPDNTPMVDGRVRAIKQVGNNVWLGGRISQVTRRDGTLLGNVGNLAVLDSQTNRYKPIAPKLGGTDAEVWDIEPYGGTGNLLIGGTFAGPNTKKNLVLVDGSTGKVIRWYDSPSLKTVLAAPGLGRVYGGGGESLCVRFLYGQEALEQGEDRDRRHARPRQQAGLPRPQARRPDDLGCVHLRRGERQPRQGTGQARHQGQPRHLLADPGWRGGVRRIGG